MAVGSFKDPNDAQGLAHYLEHMLFMGTAKYPDENDYSKVKKLWFSLSLNMEAKIMLILVRNRQIIC